MKIEVANISIYDENWDNIELTPTQLKVVFEVLNIKFQNDGTYNCKPDEYLKKIVLLKLKELSSKQKGKKY